MKKNFLQNRDFDKPLLLAIIAAAIVNNFKQKGSWKNDVDLWKTNLNIPPKWEGGLPLMGLTSTGGGD